MGGRKMIARYDTLFDESAGSIRRGFENGEIVCRERGSGKTTALLQHVHDKHGTNAYVVVPSKRFIYCLDRMWRSMYPEEFQPYFVMYAKHLGRGTGWPIYADEFNMLYWEDQDDLLRHPNFKGGVTS